MPTSPSVTVIAGGGGGAKLAHGLAQVVPDVTVVVNTADDTELHGLWISPDVDTVLYTLAGRIDPVKGWGLAGDTDAVLRAMTALGEDTWFHLGDQDLATHVVRTARLRTGATLSQVTEQLRAALHVSARVLPMSDDRVATTLRTADGTLGFQEYFVRRQHRDEVLGVSFEGVEAAHPAPGVLEAMTAADVVVLGPSNPFVSIGPVLAVPGVRDALATSGARRMAVSPVVGGRVLKGPAAHMLATLGHDVSALGVARLYAGLVDVFVIDERDAHLAPAIRELGMAVHPARTVMGPDAADRARFGRDLLAIAAAPHP